ncbi:calcium-dependent protein kinase 28-like [Rutidosis leptorrhynchoides]|uniref:calcium-dependent protein kinase 28-like n=1 Tax=Rutidosis leptorrhynchoides TaxID=125765 RepID=UPI003A99A3A8
MEEGDGALAKDLPWKMKESHVSKILETIRSSSLNDIHTGLKGSIDPLLEEADIDKNGKISLSEFRRLLRTASMGSRIIT